MESIETALEDYESPLTAEFERPCPACDGTGEYMGTLARLQWYHCRNCGIEFNIAK